ncbi:mitosis protein Dim1 [Hamiltosporidium tvaerminnensis]|uniref:Mitosis protein Dim1 n=1 Tax=Hamiltosporidium tvaerminnensis TaxID=1176355 RepID=A0A4Q9LVR8_9MICR|nr:mitosis protein Dim1 [Hamiltosporidium tvaerminnensis]
MENSILELKNSSEINQKIKNENKKLVVINFGHTDTFLYQHYNEIFKDLKFKLSLFVDFYNCQILNVRELIQNLDLYDDVNIMCFYRQKHIKMDFSTGNNTKINFYIKSKEELIDIFTLIFKEAVKGKNIVLIPTDHTYNKFSEIN